MRISRVNGSLRAARAVASQHEAALERVYADYISKAARLAARNFRSHALTAAVTTPPESDGNPDWQLPPEGVLIDYSTLVPPAALVNLHREIIQDTAGRTIAAAGISWDITHPLSQALLESSAQRTGLRLGEAVQPLLRETVLSAYQRGLSVPDTAALIQEQILGATRWQAQMLARTDLNSLSNGGSVMAAQIVGVQYKQWLTAEDDRVRETHVEADGQVVPIDSPFVVGGEELDYPGDPSGSDEETCNCFPAETLVDGHVEGAFRMSYDGDLVRITTTGYRELSGTPNHPVLTTSGWKPLAELKEGDHLVCARLDQEMTAGAPHIEDVPPRIAEVFNALGDSGSGIRTLRDGVNFHGDVPAGEVDVVWADGPLWHGRTATVSEPYREFLFPRSNLTQILLSLDSASDSLVGGGSLLATRLMRRSGESRSLLDAGVRHADTHRGGEIARRNAMLLKASADHGATDSEVDGEALFRGACQVTTDQVSSIDRYAFHGDVFTLQTPEGYYTANGIVSKNCRCTVIYLDPSEVAETASARVRSPVMAAATGVRWVSDIAFEGTATDDGRYILPGALTWRELPLTLMGLTETGPGGHEGAFVAGRMDKITRTKVGMDGEPLEDGLTAIRSEGVFDVGGEFGAEVARLVEDETVRGVSIDLAVAESALRDPETGEIIELEDADEDTMMRAMMGELQMVVKAGTIMAATVCPTPAFANARIAVTAGGARVLRLTTTYALDRETLTASAAGLAPLKPPAGWFHTVEPGEPTPLTVTPEGRVYGHIAAWGTCHTGRQGECFNPPSSPSGYKFFNLGEVECADGTRVSCGQITLDTDHASLNSNGRSAKGHYEHTGTVAADVRAVDGKHGIWVAGAVRPNIGASQARALMASKPSGDWRSMTPGGPLELIGVLAVNVPGFPVPRTEARLVASVEHPDGQVEALIASGLVEDAALDRRIRVLAARAEGGVDAMAALAGV